MGHWVLSNKNFFTFKANDWHPHRLTAAIINEQFVAWDVLEYCNYQSISHFKYYPNKTIYKLSLPKLVKTLFYPGRRQSRLICH